MHANLSKILPGLREKMNEGRDEALEELKRADHLVFVTLKYTRTADVIKNAIKRLINACDFIIIEALEHAKNKRKIKAIPLTPKSRCEVLEKLIKHPDIKMFIRFYNLLKKIDKAEFTKKNEYRKHVALIAIDEYDKNIEVDIAILVNYFERTRDYVYLIKSWIRGEI